MRFVHAQDHRETDLLDSPEYAAHEGGFAAAADGLGQSPALYHLDTSQPEAPRTRTLGEELARVVRGRAANPAWIAGMMRHGYRGGAEIARTRGGAVRLRRHAAAAARPRSSTWCSTPRWAMPAVDAFLRAANPAGAGGDGGAAARGDTPRPVAAAAQRGGGGP